jgi:hypothetical protein
MSQALTKDEIYRILATRHSGQDPKILKEISYNLALASTTESSLDGRAAQALKRLQGDTNPPSKVLHQAAQAASHNQRNRCPICKSAMEVVKLLEDQPAYHCVQHKITEPFPKETGGT